MTVTLRLSPEARKGWEDAALKGGVTLTALAEAIGQIMHAQDGAITAPGVVELARHIDLERRNRRKTRERPPRPKSGRALVSLGEANG